MSLVTPKKLYAKGLISTCFHNCLIFYSILQTITIISIIGAIAVGFAIFAAVILINEKKGKPMFVAMDEMENGHSIDIEPAKESDYK